MPTNKNASIRYQALDKCFRDKHHRYYVEDLLEKCEEALYYYNGVGGVSRRQIFDDIKFMESEAGWSIPLEHKKDGRKVYYRYSDSNFSINKQPLTDDEAQQLKSVIQTLSRFRGLSKNEWMEEVISNLEWRFNLNKSDQNIIGFEQNMELKGLNYLSPIIDATSRQQVLRIKYQSFKENAQEKTVIIHPYYVKQYNNRWFLMALTNDTQYISNFPLDRISYIEIVEDTAYIPNNGIDFEHYFDEIIGVTIPKKHVEKELITLQLTTKQFSYVAAKPLHPSQKIVDECNRILSIEVKPNYELDYNILSLGPDVEVLSPNSYREHIRQKIEECFKKYNRVQEGCTNNN